MVLAKHPFPPFVRQDHGNTSRRCGTTDGYGLGPAGGMAVRRGIAAGLMSVTATHSWMRKSAAPDLCGGTARTGHLFSCAFGISVLICSVSRWTVRKYNEKERFKLSSSGKVAAWIALAFVTLEQQLQGLWRTAARTAPGFSGKRNGYC